MDAKDFEGDVNAQGRRQMHPLHSSLPLLIPKGATWKSIGIEHHLQPPAECEMCLPQYLICILLSEYQTERRENGGRLHRNHVKSGQVIVYPATSEHWIRWQEQAEFLLLLLDPDLVAQTADELTPRTTVEIIESEERDDPLIQQIGLALKNEINEGVDTSSSLYAESLATALSAHLLRHYNVWKPALREAVGKY